MKIKVETDKFIRAIEETRKVTEEFAKGIKSMSKKQKIILKILFFFYDVEFTILNIFDRSKVKAKLIGSIIINLWKRFWHENPHCRW